MNLEWTTERAEQLELFGELLREARAINSANNILTRLPRLIELADTLTDSITGGETSFLGFLTQLAIVDRMLQQEAQKIAAETVDKTAPPEESS